MQNPSHKAINLLVCLLHFLNQETKDKLMGYVCTHKLDITLFRMIKEKLFPDWFCEEFCNFDPLYETLDGLRYVLAHAVRGKTIELVLGGGVYRYRFPMSEEECTQWLAGLGVTAEQARQWAEKLQEHLLGGESRAQASN